MHTSIDDVELRDGSRMTVVEVEGPDTDWRDRVIGRLAHKPPVWRWHIELAVDGRTPGLTSRFHLGLIRDRVVANISCWQNGPVALISHVFTDPAYRGRGIASVLMDATIAGTRARGGRVMSLLTGYDTSPFRIYRRAGFQPARDRGGSMVWEHEPGDLERLLDASRPWRARSATWADWPGTSALHCVPGGAVLRSTRHGVYGPACFEAEFLTDHESQVNGQYRQVVLEHNGMVGAYVAVGPDPRWGGAVWLLDLFAHPRLVNHAPEMLAMVAWPDAKVQCYTDADQTQTGRALDHAGFTVVARLDQQIRTPDGRWLDALLYHRVP